MEVYFTNHFIKYLFEIGIIDKKSVTDLITAYTNIKKNNTYENSLDFKDAMCASLIYYFNSINDEQKQKISLNLIVKFFENHQKKKERQLKLIILTQQSKEFTEKKEFLKKFVKKWKKKIKKNKLVKSFSSLNLSTQYQKITHQKLFKNNKQHVPSRIKLMKKNSNLSSSMVSEKSWEIKEREDFQECTFNPTINQNSLRSSMNNISVYERLYKDKEKYDTKKQVRALEIEHYRAKDNTFKPELISSRKFRSNKNMASFNERQESFCTNKSKHFEEILTQTNESIGQNCSFTPVTNHSQSNSRKSSKDVSPIQIKLYNHFCNKKTKETTKPRKSRSFIENPKIDYKKIENLYNEYKNKPKKQESYKWINELNPTYNSGISLSSSNNENNKNLSKFEKEEITKKIIQRLYGKMNKNNFGEDEYKTGETFSSMKNSTKEDYNENLPKWNNNIFSNEPRENLYIEDFYLNYNK